MYTRTQYLQGEASHADYFGQFVGPQELREVRRKIGIKWLLKSRHPYFIDIPLSEWDRLTPSPDMIHALRGAGEVKSVPIPLGTTTCIFKEAARLLLQQPVYAVVRNRDWNDMPI